jgi:phosphoglycerate dehydrogenase-like enzyme
MKKILLTGALSCTQNQINNIENLGYQVTFVQEERKKLDIDVDDFDVVICNNLFLYNNIEDFTKLKLIQLTSAGLDRVPLDYIKENNIKILNAIGIYSNPISEWVILKVLEVYKKTKTFVKQQVEKKWIKQRDLLELTNKNIAIVGYGSIGKAVAKKFKAFESKIYAFDITDINDQNVDKFCNINTFDDFLSKMDIIVLTLPLNDSTKNFINADRLLKMKIGAVLVNVSRGGIVNETDLVNVLNTRTDITAVLDVFREEPLINDNIWSLQNAIITPHNAYASVDNNNRLFNLIYTNLGKYTNTNN